MQHLNVAIKYIDHSGLGDGEATEVVTGKYMHPKYQRNIRSCGQRKRLAIGEIK
jgi:tryptophan 2,3-dioxygenase